MLELDKVRFGYAAARFEFDFQVPRSECAALMGPSGSGKSTLLNLIAGFLTPESGAIRFDGKLLNELEPSKRPLTILFQEHNLFSHLGVWKNIAIGLHPGMKLNHEEATRVERALGEVGLTGFEKRLPGSLSGGQKQRVALARCLVREKPLLLLDEPFSSLDESLREEMLDLVGALQQEKSLTLLMATHQRRDAERIADRVVVLGEGRNLEDKGLLHQTNPMDYTL